MRSKHIFTAALATAMVAAPVTRASADAGNLVGGIVGGIIGGALVNSANKRPTQRVYVKPTYVNPGYSVTRQANRETQTALNYFGYPAGTPDGVLGSKSRAAASAYQAYMSFPITGNLNQFERDILIGAYTRGISGGYDTTQLIARDPDGVKALLVAQRDIMTGGNTPPRRTAGYAGLPLEVSDAVDEIAESSDPSPEQLLQRSGFIQLADLNGDGNNDYILDTSFAGSSFWCNSAQCKTLVFVSTPNGYARNDLLQANPIPASFNCVGSSCVIAKPETNTETMMVSTQPVPEVSIIPETSLTSGGALPLFNVPTATVSLASHCAKVGMLTNANGGYTNTATMTDPKMVLNEQFCLARAYAMDTEQKMIASMGVTTAQVDGQCRQYGDALKGYVSAFGVKSRGDVMRDVGSFVLSSGMDAAQLNATAKICLGAGYRLDDMNIAIGTGLLLVVLGEAPYGELMGHHLTLGFGAGERVDLAMPWYGEAMSAIDNGTPAVFAPDQYERTALVQDAVGAMAGGGKPVLKPIETSGIKAKLPTFGVSEKKSR